MVRLVSWVSDLTVVGFIRKAEEKPHPLTVPSVCVFVQRTLAILILSQIMKDNFCYSNL